MFDNPLSYSDETKVLKKEEPQNKLNEIYVLGPIMSMLITTVKSLIIIDQQMCVEEYEDHAEVIKKKRRIMLGNICLQFAQIFIYNFTG